VVVSDDPDVALGIEAWLVEVEVIDSIVDDDDGVSIADVVEAVAVDDDLSVITEDVMGTDEELSTLEVAEGIVDGLSKVEVAEGTEDVLSVTRDETERVEELSNVEVAEVRMEVLALRIEVGVAATLDPF
jgi:hypothetical protein